jgi:hypothetical protein
MHRTIACAFFLCTASILAGDAREDWSALTALDAGPVVATQPKTAAEAFALALGHTEKQERALRAFLAAHSDDTHAFEAMLRLARVLDLRAEMKSEPPSGDAAGLLQKAGQMAATPEHRTELEFALLTRRMRNWRSNRPPIDERRALFAQAREFENAHPGDRRIPMLLAEIAALFDFEPATKESLLLRAKKLTKDPGLTAQITDDLRRLGFLGKPLPLRFTALDGRRVDVKNWQGKVVGIVFFATWSAPSRVALAELRRTIEAEGARAQLAAISLDANRADVENFLRAQGITIPVGWDGKVWDSPLLQALGINSVPTAWLLDTKGVLRSLDALEDPAGQIRRLLGAK